MSVTDIALAINNIGITAEEAARAFRQFGRALTNSKGGTMAEGEGYIYSSYKKSIMEAAYGLPSGFENIVIDGNRRILELEFAEFGDHKCLYCGNPSGLTDRRGMCISCGGRNGRG